VVAWRQRGSTGGRRGRRQQLCSGQGELEAGAARVSLELRRVEAKGKALGRLGKRRKEGEGGVRLGGVWRKREGGGPTMVRGVRRRRHRPGSGGAGRAVCARRAGKRERDVKVAGGPPGEWGPATEGEKKGREGDRWDRLRVGPSGRERRERALTGGPLGLNEFDLFQTHSNLIWSKHDPPVLQKFDIKYGWKVFATRNNLVHRNLFRIRMDFELKFR
jgi:hypothetical protein